MSRCTNRHKNAAKTALKEWSSGMVRFHNGEMRVGPVSEAGLTSKASSGGLKKKKKKKG